MLIGARIRSEEGVDAPPLLITFCVLPVVPTSLARGHWTLHALPMSTDLSELAVMQRGNVTHVFNFLRSALVIAVA